METEINIVEILKDKPQGTKLYSSACGKCKLEEVDDKSFKISFYNSKFGFISILMICFQKEVSNERA